MHGSYFRLVVVVSLKHPQAAQDVVLRTSRTIPFQPHEGLTLVLPSDDGSEEYELTLGPPRYDFAESGFIEYQEDPTLMDAYRNNTYNHNSVGHVVEYYKQFGFERVRPNVEAVA